MSMAQSPNSSTFKDFLAQIQGFLRTAGNSEQCIEVNSHNHQHSQMNTDDHQHNELDTYNHQHMQIILTLMQWLHVK